uniref:Histone acetyltransferase HAC5 n=1 Tax=Lygus hesperus TaxID=30085 RepID=A0A0A9Z8J3_LYGHE
MEAPTQELETLESGLETLPSSAVSTFVPVPGASGDHGGTIYCPLPGDVMRDLRYMRDKFPITAEGVSVALPRDYRGSQGSTPHILAAAGGAEPTEGDSPSASDGRNRGPPASSGQAGQDDGAPQRSFYEFLPLLIFAIGTVAILRVAAHRGKIPKA